MDLGRVVDLDRGRHPKPDLPGNREGQVLGDQNAVELSRSGERRCQALA